MLKKTGLLVWFFFLLSLPLYAQIFIPGLYHGQTLPLPIDPGSCKAMNLTQTDLDCKEKAESYIKQGKSDLAVESLRNISDSWTYHWFLSYMHEINFDFHNALREIDWLIFHTNCRTLMLSLEDRKKNLEEAIRKINQWGKNHPTPLHPEEKPPTNYK